MSMWTAFPPRVPSSFPCHSSFDEVSAYKQMIQKLSQQETKNLFMYIWDKFSDKKKKKK